MATVVTAGEPEAPAIDATGITENTDGGPAGELDEENMEVDEGRALDRLGELVGFPDAALFAEEKPNVDGGGALKVITVLESTTDTGTLVETVE